MRRKHLGATTEANVFGLRSLAYSQSVQRNVNGARGLDALKIGANCMLNSIELLYLSFLNILDIKIILKNIPK